MKLSVGVFKQRSEKFSRVDSKDVLIDTGTYWLTRDTVFTADNITKHSSIRDVDRSDGRFHIATYTSDDKNIEINIYVVYPLNKTPLLVGVMRGDDDRIIFELPLSDDERSLSMAEGNGFEVGRYDLSEDSYPYLDPDIIDRTYHDSRKRLHGYNDISYTKLIGKTLEISVHIDYTAGAEEI